MIGGGLAGCEAALQLADHGIAVTLFEMRPTRPSPAHHSSYLAELVCSNSLKSDDPHRAAGLLKRELERMGSHLLRIARACAVAAGSALAVDRSQFAQAVTEAVESHPAIELCREEFIYHTPHGFDALIIAAGPLASDSLIDSIRALVGTHLSFYDAVAPIIAAESIDFSQAFYGSRYGKGESTDYVNCPFTQHEYRVFHQALIDGERVVAHAFESKEMFAACQPIEEVARSGFDALRFGALKPVGLTVPATGARAYACVQLRAEDAHRQAYNLVGFQTNLTWPEQQRIFRMIPGLAHAEFLRYGVMHRNTFIDAPRLCDRFFSLKSEPSVWFAGQITGTEGYTEAIASGLYVARNVAARLNGTDAFELPPTTVAGALFHYATNPHTKPYQPMHVNFGIIEPLDQRQPSKRARFAAYAERSLKALGEHV